MKERPILMTPENAQKVWDRLNKRIEMVTESGCWIWTGSGAKRYGLISVDGRKILVHRLTYHLSGRTIPDSYTVDHLCRVPECCNPNHLEAVTFAENVRRGIAVSAINGRKTHCKRGHEFTSENTHLTNDGRRVCRACDRQMYEENKKEVLEERKSYYLRNREAVKARCQSYRERKRRTNG